MGVYAHRHLPKGIDFQQPIPVAHMEHAITVGYVEGQLVRIYDPSRSIAELMSAVKLFLVHAAKDVARDACSTLEQRCFVPHTLLPQSLAFMSSTTAEEFHARHPEGSQAVEQKYVELDGRLWNPAISSAVHLREEDHVAQYERLALILIGNTENMRRAIHEGREGFYRERIPESIRKALEATELVPS